jgi:hypothetical protein
MWSGGVVMTNTTYFNTSSVARRIEMVRSIIVWS